MPGLTEQQANQLALALCERTDDALAAEETWPYGSATRAEERGRAKGLVEARLMLLNAASILDPWNTQHATKEATDGQAE